MAEPPRPPRPAPGIPPREESARPASAGTPGPTPVGPPRPRPAGGGASQRAPPPRALPLGRATESTDLDLSMGTPSRAFGTTPLRPLIDIAQPRLTLIVDSEGGNTT